MFSKSGAKTTPRRVRTRQRKQRLDAFEWHIRPPPPRLPITETQRLTKMYRVRQHDIVQFSHARLSLERARSVGARLDRPHSRPATRDQREAGVHEQQRPIYVAVTDNF